MSTEDNSTSVDRSKRPSTIPTNRSSHLDPVSDRPNRLSVAVAVVVFSAIAIGLLYVPSLPVKVIGVLLFIWTVKTWVLETLFP